MNAEELDRLIHPSRLVLEVTESVCVDERNRRADLPGMKELGVLLSLDDFGTGKSSLTELRHAPFDMLKIDGSVVTDPSAMDYVEGIIVMAQTMGACRSKKCSVCLAKAGTNNSH